MATLTAPRKRNNPDPYLELIQTVHPLRPIHTDEEHQTAKRALRSLVTDNRPVALDYKKVLISLIVTYEKEAGHRLDTSGISPADIIRHLLQQRGMTPTAFAKQINLSQSTLSDMLRGKRAWSKSAIITISRYFSLNPAIFLK